MDSLRRNARALRNRSTDAERQLWRYLRGRQLDGFRFRRQVPLAGYVVDFLCPQARLIIELDGGQHLEQIAYDQRRTAALVGLGYRVARYWNDDVLMKIDDVVADIHRHITEGFTPPQPVRPAGIACGRSSGRKLMACKRPSSPPSLCGREGANSNSNSNSRNSESNSNESSEGEGE
ncbi:endonuclease domain-containing protein [Lysobacter koreensis]|uniref:Endonuclease domain-containing protein n=1 Tax=Lysobacter koreensis TaxID=266122 RepID=A0ABW2YN36_9GAMM